MPASSSISWASRNSKTRSPAAAADWRDWTAWAIWDRGWVKYRTYSMKATMTPKLMASLRAMAPPTTQTAT